MTQVHELSVSRFIDAAPQIVWRAFTEHAPQWFTPRPWTTPMVHYDLFPGGRADVVMRSPQGEEHHYRGVILEVEKGRRIVSTGAMTQGWVPQAGDMNFVRIDSFEPKGTGTQYTASARHWDENAMKIHAEMGFEEGWGIVADQLAEVAMHLSKGM